MTRHPRMIVGPALLALWMTAVCLPGCSDTSTAVDDEPAATPAMTSTVEPPHPSGEEPATTLEPPATPLPAVNAGTLLIEPGGYDFGEIDPRAEREVTLTMTNTGAAPLEVINMVPTCQCTVAERMDGVRLQAGQSRDFKLSFRAPIEPGEKTARVTVRVREAAGLQHTRLKLMGMITMAVSADPPYTNALKGTTTGETRVVSSDGRPFRIISTDGETPVFTDGFDPAADEPRNAYTVRWTIPPRGTDDCEGMRLWWVIETDHPECPILPMRVRHECTGSLSDPTRKERGWYFDEYIVPLGAIRGGEPVDADIDLVYLRGAPRNPITAVRPLTDDATAELISMTPGDGSATVRVRFTPREGYTGMLYAMVYLDSISGGKDVSFVARVQ